MAKLSDEEEDYLRDYEERMKVGDELKSRLGKLVVDAIQQQLQATTPLSMIGNKTLEWTFNPPQISQGGEWYFDLDVRLPDQAGILTFRIDQFTGWIDCRSFNLPLPPRDFDFPADDPKVVAHHKAFNHLTEQLTDILEAEGFSDGKHFSPPDDYLGSDIIELSIKDPRIFRRSIATALQKALVKTKFRFVISMQAMFGSERIKDGQHILIIRRDRIVPDWNVKVLKTASRGRFSWS